MAQTGFTPILTYGSTTATNVPLAANLTTTADGVELAINATDGKLFYKDNAGAVQVLATKGAGTIGGATTQVQFNNSGALAGSANLTFNGTTLTAAGLAGPLNGTVGATTPATASVTTLTASADSSFTSTGAVLLPAGTTAQRPTGVAGKLRFNNTTTQFEGYNGTVWSSVGGAAITNDTATATDLFPLYANATSGSATTVYTSNAKLLYKPSTGEFKSSAMVSTNGIHVNNSTVSSSYTIASGQNGLSVGPVTVAGGIVVTVSSGSRWVVL